MKLIILLFSFGLFACQTSYLHEKESIEWHKQANIPGHLRIDAAIVVHENEAFLMPGRGGYHLGIEPEIFRFFQNKWTEVAIYDGWAKAGGYGSWKYNDLIYLVGGVNGSGSQRRKWFHFQ